MIIITSVHVFFFLLNLSFNIGAHNFLNVLEVGCLGKYYLEAPKSEVDPKILHKRWKHRVKFMTRLCTV